MCLQESKQRYQHEDEFFLVIKGELKIKLRDHKITLKNGEFVIIPKGVDHLPYAEQEAHVLLFEHKYRQSMGKRISKNPITYLGNFGFMLLTDKHKELFPEGFYKK